MAQTDLTFYQLNTEKKSYLPLGSARGCKQVLSPLHTPCMQRTLDGRLICLEPPIQKYASIITCKDRLPAALENIFPGTLLRVECIQRLIMPLTNAKNTIILSRPAVPSSLFFLKKEEEAPLKLVSETMPDLSSVTGEGHIIYRPILDMMVIKHTVETDEWGASLSWEMVLHEL